MQLALDHWGWADPLLQTDTDGDVIRPSTFFQSVATGNSDGQSSIDGILMNRTALSALLHIEALDHQDRQHRPVKATFMWDKLLQSGTIMQRPAVLNLDNIQHADPTDPGCPVNSFSEQLWHHYAQQFDLAADADTKNGLSTMNTLLNCWCSMVLCGVRVRGVVVPIRSSSRYRPLLPRRPMGIWLRRTSSRCNRL